MPEFINRNKAHLPFLALVLVLGVYLGLKTLPEDGWSGWREGSAQTLLTIEHWDRDGMLYHRLLFIPIGYSKAAKYIDEPEMRHHARGTVSGGLIGRRLYYTHYPSGYIIPFALLKKAGAEKRHSFRLLSLGVSLTALLLLYVFLNQAAPPAAAFFGVLYYAASTMFLDYADSLANQPIDDLLRFAILALSLYALRIKDEEEARKYTFVTWLLYLVLSSSSYDSVLFVFAWLVGLDIAAGAKAGKGLKDLAWKTMVKRWAFFATAPALSFGLQLIQNFWYLGLGDLILDFKGVFLARIGSGAELGGYRRFSGVVNPFRLMAGIHAPFALASLAILTGAYLYLRRKIFYRWPEAWVFALLLVAGSVYTVLFSRTIDLDYQGRQLAPAFAFIIGASMLLFTRLVSSPRALLGRKASLSMAAALALTGSLAFLWWGQVNRTVEYVSDWPNNRVERTAFNVFKTLGAMTDKDAVIFSIDPNFNKEHPQPPPILEFYAGKMVLNFRDPEAFVRDFAWLKRRAEEPFDSIIFSPEPRIVEEFLPLSKGKEIRIVDGYYMLLVEG